MDQVRIWEAMMRVLPGADRDHGGGSLGDPCFEFASGGVWGRWMVESMLSPRGSIFTIWTQIPSINKITVERPSIPVALVRLTDSVFYLSICRGGTFPENIEGNQWTETMMVAGLEDEV